MGGLDGFFDALRHVKVQRLVRFAEDGAVPADAVVVGRTPASASSGALVLDNKAARQPSVSRLAAALTEAELASWPLWHHRPLGPQESLDAMTLVVEDASPDSVWAVVLLLARLAGCSLDARLDPWLESVERWETEGMVDDPWTAWPSLASALGHAQFTRAERNGGSVTEPDILAAWTKGLRFAAECLAHGAGPAGLSGTGIPLLAEAVAALRQEEQAYRDWLQHANVVQLSVPLAAGNRRRMVVDALLFTEDQPTGAAKAIYRNDGQAPLRAGFTLAASYRPGAPKGSGNEFTITLDPRRKLDLQELWEELERREDAAWRAAEVARPAWDPRGILGSPYNQPWYLDPSHTLIAAPRAVHDTRVTPAVLLPGTRLGWAEVQDALWTVFNPLRHVAVVTAGSPHPVPLMQVPAKQLLADGRRLVLARWPQAGPDGALHARALPDAPVVERILAALLLRGPDHPVGLGDLPAAGGWERVPLSGGFAVVSQAGLFVLDDWRPTAALDLVAIEQAFEAAVRLDARLAEMAAGPLPELLAAVDGRVRGTRDGRGLVAAAARLSVDLAALRGTAGTVPGNPDARAVREALDRRWGLERRLAAMEQQAKAIGDSLKALGDARVRRITQLVALVGFPFYVASGLATPLGRLMIAWGWVPPVGTEVPAVLWWDAFLGVLAILLAVGWVVQRGDRMRNG